MRQTTTPGQRRQATLLQQLLDEKATGVGASECHHLFDVPPYGCRRQLWYSKTRHPADFPFLGNRDTERGTELESLVVQRYQRETGRRCAKEPCRRHPSHPEWLCHPDRRIQARGKPPGLLEVKCPGVRNFLRCKREGLPEAWILQLQHGLGATGFRWGSFAVFSAELWELLHFDMDKDWDLQQKIRRGVTDFWRLTENGPAPERLSPEDPRCGTCPYRTTCQGDALLARLRDRNEETGEGETLPQDTHLDPLVRTYLEAQGLVAEAEQLKAVAKERLEEALGDRQAVHVPGLAKVYYRGYEQKRIDADALRRLHPDVAGAVERRSVVRSLRVISL